MHKLNDGLIETLSEKFVSIFVGRITTAVHIRADLKQEAAIAIALAAPRWSAKGGANMETFTKIYAWRAMQIFCSKQSGPVSRPTDQKGHFEGTQYGTEEFTHQVSDGVTPETIYERRQADAIVKTFVKARAKQFSGSGKLSQGDVRHVLTEVMAGDSCAEVGKRYGVSKQGVHQIVTKAGVL